MYADMLKPVSASSIAGAHFCEIVLCNTKFQRVIRYRSAQHRSTHATQIHTHRHSHILNTFRGAFFNPTHTQTHSNLSTLSASEQPYTQYSGKNSFARKHPAQIRADIYKESTRRAETASRCRHRTLTGVLLCALCPTDAAMPQRSAATAA